MAPRYASSGALHVDERRERISSSALSPFLYSAAAASTTSAASSSPWNPPTPARRHGRPPRGTQSVGRVGRSPGTTSCRPRAARRRAASRPPPRRRARRRRTSRTAPERDDVAPGQDRLRRLVGSTRHQQQDGIGGRFLEHLEERVRRGRRRAIGLTVQDALRPARERPIGGGPDLFTDGVHVDVAALGLDQEHVGVIIREREPAGPARSAAAVRAQERGDGRPAATTFPSPRAREHVGIVRTLGGGGQERHGGILPVPGRGRRSQGDATRPVRLGPPSRWLPFPGP